MVAGRERPVSEGGGVRSRHGLSFGGHYDPGRTSWGALVAHNDDTLAPGSTYGRHDHRDVEILTWVLAGRMRHDGPDGSAVVAPGTLQHLAAGTGWHHDEACDGDEPVRLLQMWIAPGLDDPPPGPPALTHVAVPREPGVPVLAAGSDDAALVRLRRPRVSLVFVRLGSGGTFAPAGAAWRHVHVAAGSVRGPGEGAARAGDSLEIAREGPVELVAGDEGAEVLVVATD